MLDQISDSMLDRKQKIMSDKMYEYMSDRSGTCLRVRERMPDEMPEYISDRLPAKNQVECQSIIYMPNRMSNRMSKQYVRVGITRSKNNFEYVKTFIYLTAAVEFPTLLLILVVLYKYTKHMGMLLQCAKICKHAKISPRSQTS